MHECHFQVRVRIINQTKCMKLDYTCIMFMPPTSIVRFCQKLESDLFTNYANL